ncbi:MAG: alpha/beta hydrolase, partial [Deltaproteobacteria bacterium]|nr:alpha/beta hydrolase [Deltaproteobacteria bacterium]
TGAMLLLPAGLGAQERTLEELQVEILRRAQQNRHPISEVKVEDVRLVLSRLTSKDPDLWAREWSRVAEPYEKKGDEQFRAGNRKEALEAYYQAYRYYYLGRWPLTNSVGKKQAYQGAIRTFLAAARLFDPPLERVAIPFDGKQIVGYLRLPKGVSRPPLIFHWGGIDGWKEDARANVEGYLAAGWASFVIDIPGTGESPILVTADAHRLFSAVLDYFQNRPEIDAARIAVQGSSWGGYWAAKIAHVERRRIRAAVNWGGPVHYYFQPEWQRKALGTREYLFGLFEARAALYGVNTVEEFLATGPKFSLRELGILGQPSAPLLSVNGKNDTQVPISDLYILMETGAPKAAWVNPAGGHMGRGPGGSPDYVLKQVVIPWLRTHLAVPAR